MEPKHRGLVGLIEYRTRNQNAHRKHSSHISQLLPFSGTIWALISASWHSTQPTWLWNSASSLTLLSWANELTILQVQSLVTHGLNFLFKCPFHMIVESMKWIGIIILYSFKNLWNFPHSFLELKCYKLLWKMCSRLDLII